ncbi:MAG TPA: sugar ABC transporter permease [Anaerolineae bacterium]|jgi:multiple sugar transport system permease protein
MNATTALSGSAGSSLQWRRIRKQLPNYLFILPHMLLFVAFLAYPIVSGLRISLYDWKIMLPANEQSYQGLNNFSALFKDDLWWKVMNNTVRFTIMTMILNIAFPLSVAVALKQTFKGRDVFRTLFFAGSVLSVSAMAIIAARIWDPLRGMLNALLVDVLNLPRIQWLGSVETVLPALSITTVWWTFGFPMLAFLTALQNIPETLYEAGKIDGASGWHTFWSITLPLITPTLLFVVSTQFIGQMQMFGQAYILTAGGPGNESKTVLIYLYETAWKFFRIGYASTMAVALAVVMIIVTRLWFFLFRQRYEY